MKRADVIIVGASFAGISCAKRAAANGLSVVVLERKKDVKDNLHTTGILVDEAAELLNVPPHLSKEIKQVRLYSSSLKQAEIRSERYIFLATDTPALMEYLVEDAKKGGVDFCLGTGFDCAEQHADRIVINNGAFECRFLVGADGAKSSVAEACHLGKNETFLIGTEFEYKGASIDNPDAFYCFFSRRYAPGYIGWVIPGPRVMQIGIAKTYRQKKQSRPDIEGFIDSIKHCVQLDGATLVEKRGGLIPVGGLVRPFFNDRVILVGDAAGIVSPLTAGGIHTALFYGARLGDLLHAHLAQGGVHPGVILTREYPRFWHKHVYRLLFNLIPDRVFDLLLKMPGFTILAHVLFFFKKRLPKRRKHG